MIPTSTNHPYRLRLVEVGNFKSIRSAQVELLPLSLLVGANSSGKSSLLQAILAISQAVRSRTAGIGFPLNGEHARFGTFSETVHFRSSDDGIDKSERNQISLQITLSNAASHALGRYRLGDSDESSDDRITIEYSMCLISHGDSERDSATLSSLKFHCYSSTNLGTDKKNFSYSIDNLADIDDDDERLAYRVISPRARSFGFRSGLATGSGSYSIARSDENDVDYESDAVELWGAIPDAVYFSSTYSDALGHQWWNRAKQYAQRATSGDGGQEGVRSDDSYAAETKLFVLETMVELAAQAAIQVQQNWTDRSKSRWSSFPVAMQLHHLMHEQFNITMTSEERNRIASGFQMETLDSFLKALAVRLKDEEWAQDQVWSCPENDFELGVEDASFMINDFFRHAIKYLGPLRKAPQVLYDPRLRDLDLGLSGEYTAAILHANAAHRVVPISATSEERVSLSSEVNRWLQEFGLASEALLSDRGRLGIGLQIAPLDTHQPVDLTSVGVGVSQILPVIVLCLLSEPGDLVILEQPELHLHPALQQQLGDFLLDCARSGRQLLVETHSEHLVNRVRRRIADPSGVDEGTVGLLFAEKQDGITTFRHAPIDRFGGSETEWPAGFFDVSAREAQALVSTSLTKRYRDSQ